MAISIPVKWVWPLSIPVKECVFLGPVQGSCLLPVSHSKMCVAVVSPNKGGVVNPGERGVTILITSEWSVALYFSPSEGKCDCLFEYQ